MRRVSDDGPRRAARLLVKLLERLAARGTTVIELATGGRRPRPFRLYPQPPLYDPRTRSLVAYHTHAGLPDWPREAGHFHAVRILRLRPEERAGIVAVSMSRRGWPQALFTFNLWGWQERPQRAHQLRAHVRRFRVGPGHGPRPVARFINLLLRAYGPEIESLQDEKLRILADLQRRRPRVDARADRSIDLLSALPIDVRARAEGREPAAAPTAWRTAMPTPRLARRPGRRA